MEEKLVKLRGGITLVRPEDKKAVEEMYSDKISQWRKRKRMFRDIWDAITENSPKDLKEFKVHSVIQFLQAMSFKSQLSGVSVRLLVTFGRRNLGLNTMKMLV